MATPSRASGSASVPPSALFYQSRLRRPLFDHAEGIYCWDRSGKRYIDGSSGAMVSNIGHANPRVIEAMQAQMRKGAFAYRLHFENEAAEALARRVAGKTPAGLNKVFFVSGGSEAVESCVKLARQWAYVTGQASRYKLISCFPSYHGATLGALSLTGYRPLSDPFLPMMVAMPKIPAPTCYLDHDDLTMEERGLRAAERLRDTIIAEGPDSVLGFIMEPVGGASTGALVAPDSYYSRIREICDEFGLLLILDEVMTGAGRTGPFLAASHWQLRPDLVALSKGFAAGYAPLGAMVADERLVDPVLDAGGFQHGFTSAGNPLACAAGLAVLDELDAQDLYGNCRRVGSLLKERLTGLMQRFPWIGDVRGKGLLLAFELVADRTTMAPLPRDLNAHLRLVEHAFERGLIIYSRRTRGGTEGDHFMVCPPLIINESQCDELLELLDQSLLAFAAEAGLPVGQSAA